MHGTLEASFRVEWRPLAALGPITPQWRDLASRVLEPNVFYEPAFALAAALIFSVLAGMFLARQMVVPIKALQVGAARIGGGDLGQRISVKTGDELEGLADQFNEMAGKLQDSYSDLERKIEVRTRELAQSVRELRALGEVSHRTKVNYFSFEKEYDPVGNLVHQLEIVGHDDAGQL